MNLTLIIIAETILLTFGTIVTIMAIRQYKKDIKALRRIKGAE